MPPILYILDSPPNNHPKRLPPQELIGIAHHAGLSSVGLSLNAHSLDTDWRHHLESAQSAGLSFRTVRISLDIRANNLPQSLHQTLRQIQDHTPLIELLLHSSSPHDPPSSPRADHHAAEIVKQLAQQATTRLALCHSQNNWLHSITDAIRLAMRINRPNVGLSFNLPDWTQTINQNLQAQLLMALPKLWNLTINLPIEKPTNPLSQLMAWRNGTDPHFQNLLALLHRLGYQGPIGLVPQASPTPAQNQEIRRTAIEPRV